MHLMKLLHKTFTKELPSIHQVRLKNLMDAAITLLKVNRLTLTALGRNFSNHSKVRSNIKKVDRLLGNSHLHSESVEFYQVMNNHLIKDNTRPQIHVDWSCLCSLTKLYLLRATLSMQGRSIVIYEECHPKKKENNHATHKAFLDNLKALLPQAIQPVIVTDAGFRAPWFSYVRDLGWDFVGRLRNKNSIQLNSNGRWILSKTLYKKATGKPSYLGEGLLTERGKIPVHLVLYKGKRKNRHRLNQRKQRSQASKSNRHAKANKEPWLLVTSMTGSSHVGLEAVNIYRQRMRIEENIRDTKSQRYGFGLNESRTRSPERMKVLLLISAVATFACWLAGIFTRQKGEAAAFQAHSSKYTGVLSVVYLGREALRKGMRINAKQFKKMLKLLFEVNIAAQLETVL